MGPHFFPPTNPVEKRGSVIHALVPQPTSSALDELEEGQPSNCIDDNHACSSTPCPCGGGTLSNVAPGRSSFLQATVNSFVLLIGIKVIPSQLERFRFFLQQELIFSRGKISYLMLLCLLPVNVGLGTLSSSYAIEKCGYFGLLVLFTTAFFFWCGTRLICKIMELDKSLMNYQDVATKAFPRWGRLLITALFYVDILGSLVGYMVSMGDTLTHIFPHFHSSIIGLSGKTFFTLVSFIVILPTVWFRNLSTISYLSFWCAISILVTVICLLVAGAKNKIGFHQKVAVFRVKNVPIATGVYTFTFGATAVFPTVYRSMHNESRFSEVMIISFGLATMMNVVIGIIGSIMFGANTKPQVHLSMPPALVASKIAIWATLLTPVTQFALFLSPISCELEEIMIKFLPWKGRSRLNYIACVLLRTTLLLAIALSALLFPYFANIIELIGSSVSVTLCVICPCVFYLKIFSRKLHKWEVLGLCTIILVSALAGGAGTFVSIRDLIDKH